MYPNQNSSSHIQTHDLCIHDYVLSNGDHYNHNIHMYDLCMQLRTHKYRFYDNLYSQKCVYESLNRYLPNKKLSTVHDFRYKSRHQH